MKTLAVIGLGYVGLPLAVEFGKKYNVIGFDIFKQRIDELKKGYDRTLEVEKDEKIYLTIIHKDSNQEDLDQSKKQATENQDKSKLAKALKEEATITNASPNIEKSAYEGRFERNRFMGGILGFEPDKFNYIMPLNISSSKEPNQRKQTEVKFQISIKKRLFDDLFLKDLDLYFAYTQQSFWQLYDSENSKPFRESNYAPSLYLSYPLKAYDLFFERVNFGYLHQSNGGDLEHSRSWDRIFIEGIYSYENFALSLKGLVWGICGESIW